jgi:hypothetical protein
MSKVLFEESRELYDLCAKTFDDASISVGEQNLDMQRANTPAKRFIFITMGIVSLLNFIFYVSLLILLKCCDDFVGCLNCIDTAIQIC